MELTSLPGQELVLAGLDDLGRGVESVEALQRLGLVEAEPLLAFYAQIEPELYRFPAIEPSRFRVAVEAAASPPSRT